MRGRFCQGTQCHFPLDPRYVRSNHGIVGQEVGWDLRVCHHSPRDAAPGHSGSHSASHTGLKHTQCCKALHHNQTTTVPLPTRLTVRAATSWGPAPTCYPAHMLQLQHWRRPHRAEVVDLAFETEGLRKRNLLTDGSNPWLCFCIELQTIPELILYLPRHPQKRTCFHPRSFLHPKSAWSLPILVPCAQSLGLTPGPA